MAARGRRTATLLVTLTVFASGAIIFLVGFFPISIARVNDVNFDVLPNLTELTRSRTPSALMYNQTILMLVDALRYDFPTAESMPFALKSACGKLKMRVNLPTVTMPRLKSLTTGTVSNFIEIVLNLGHDEKVENSILHNMRQKDYQLVFAGDRTWVELFPNLFQRKTPNMDSFFVNDFYEGDMNVTRILKEELKRDDWQLFILHYLGLDHIGHVEGSESAKIPPKLREMDESIKLIYEAKHYSSQLVLVTGDHGMRNGGGHGGATWEELHVPLLYFKKNCLNRTAKNAPVYNQIDVAPTLAILMGVDIPKNSIGCLLPDLLEDLPNEKKLQAYALNAQHLANKVANKHGLDYVLKSDFFEWLVIAQRLHSEYVRRVRESNAGGIVLYEEVKSEYMRASQEMSTQLSAALVNFDYEYIVLGSAIAILSTLHALVYSVEHLPLHNRLQKYCYASIAGVVLYIAGRMLQYIQASNWTKCCILIWSLSVILYILMRVIKPCAHIKLRSIRNSFKQLSLSQRFLLVCYAFTICSLASSSFIEYEERMWHYLGCSVFVQFVGAIGWMHVRKVVKRSENVISYLMGHFGELMLYGAVILIISIAPRYAQIKMSAVDLSLTLCLGLILLAFQLRRLLSRCQWILSAVALFCVFVIRVAVYAKYIDVLLTTFWLCIAGIAVLAHIHLTKKASSSAFSGVFTCLLIITALLHKPQNVVLIPLLLFVLKTSYKLCEDLFKSSSSPLTKVLLTIFVSKIFYFSQGNTNSLATIDLNPGFIGQTTYNPAMVFVFVTLNTYSAPLSAFLYLVLHIKDSRDSVKQTQHLSTKVDFYNTLCLYIISIILPTCIYMCLLIALRYHLFIYSVFAPKIFYEVFNVFVHHFIMVITYCYH